MPPKCLQPRILVQKLPGLILCLISNLRLPGMNLSCPMFRVWLEWRYLVRIVLSSHTKPFTNTVLRICSQRSCIRDCASSPLSNLLLICSNLNTIKSSSETFHIFNNHSLLSLLRVLSNLLPNRVDKNNHIVSLWSSISASKKNASFFRGIP